MEKLSAASTKKERWNLENKKEENFEDALEKLEEIVRQLEEGDLPLSEALKKFEEGVKLAKFCEKRLDEAERKIQKLVEKEGKIQLEKFEKMENKK